ncbi:MAG: DUF2269 family protein [Hyphomicrobium sp.]
MTYLAFKSIHILGVVLFLGNIIITGFWKFYADANARPEVVGFAQRLVTLTDWMFTAGGIALILIGGYGMAHVAELSVSETPWIRHGLTLFITSGDIWAAVLIPIQIVQARIARSFENGGEVPPRYWRLSRHWLIWGAVATILPLINLYVMVLKV